MFRLQKASPTSAVSYSIDNFIVREMVYAPDIITNNDHYPFGQQMPGRSWVGGDKYRYGFNGKEIDDEIQGNGSSLDFGARIYDPRIGRFLSGDPLAQFFPFQSPYLFASNTPIWAIDKDGEYTVFIAGAVYKGEKKGLLKNTFSQDLCRTMNKILNRGKNARHFDVVNAASNPNLIEKGKFTLNNGFKPSADPSGDKLLDQVVTEIINGYKLARNENSEEKINLIGSSYGSVMAAQVALELEKRGYKVTSIVLTATPLNRESELGRQLTEKLESKGTYIYYQYNSNDVSQGSFKTDRSDWFMKNFYKNPIRYFGHINNMFNNRRVDDIIRETIVERKTEGDDAASKGRLRSKF